MGFRIEEDKILFKKLATPLASPNLSLNLLQDMLPNLWKQKRYFQMIFRGWGWGVGGRGEGTHPCYKTCVLQVKTACFCPKKPFLTQKNLPSVIYFDQRTGAKPLKKARNSQQICSKFQQKQVF